MQTKLIYCAAGNERFGQIAIEQGFTYGAQLPNTIYHTPRFVDQNWKNPNRVEYMQALETYKPALATVLDWERQEQFDEVMQWAREAAQHADEVIIIPKVMGGISQIPNMINGKPVRLGYSVPTTFGGTMLPLWEFGGRPVHLLGGSPKKQIELSNYLNVVSADGNYSQKMATQYNQFYACNGQARTKDRYWPRLAELHPIDYDAPYHAFRLSCINIQAEWSGCRAYIRYGIESDLPAIQKIAYQYRGELGRVMRPALQTAITKHELYVAEYMGQVVGFVNWHKRRDGWSTIYEVAVDKSHKLKHIGSSLVNAVPAPRRLKCTVDNPANEFYKRLGMAHVKVEDGRKRQLNVWEYQT